MSIKNLPPSVVLNDNPVMVEIIDQRKLPQELKILKLTYESDFRGAIETLAVRGAPAIGICAAYGIYVCAVRFMEDNPTADTSALLESLRSSADFIIAARPTAVNLKKGVDTVMAAAAGSTADEIISAMKAAAIRFHQNDIQMCTAISEYGLTLIKDGDGILTHCNAGPLATSVYGTGLGSIIMGCERGMKLRAYVDETRPLLQGARLTALELKNAGADVNLICDNMAAYVMSKGLVQAVFTGCDRVAANGDAANKIGTMGAAVLAKHFGIPMYIFCPSSTIDFSCRSGKDIVIEQRDPREITELHYEKRMAPEGVKCINPAFDVTPAELITAIITEKGICRAPFEKNLAEMFNK